MWSQVGIIAVVSFSPLAHSAAGWIASFSFRWVIIMQKADVYHDAFPHIILFPISHFITTNISLQAHSRSRQETQQSTHCSKTTFSVQKFNFRNLISGTQFDIKFWTSSNIFLNKIEFWRENSKVKKIEFLYKNFFFRIEWKVVSEKQKTFYSSICTT